MSFFRRPALVLCRTYAVAEIISSHELEIFTLATLSSLKVCCVDFLLSRLCYVFACSVLIRACISSSLVIVAFPLLVWGPMGTLFAFVCSAAFFCVNISVKNLMLKGLLRLVKCRWPNPTPLQLRKLCLDKPKT